MVLRPILNDKIFCTGIFANIKKSEQWTVKAGSFFMNI